MKLSDSLRTKALRWVLFVFFVVSILAGVFGWGTEWSVSLILLALLLLIQQVQPVEEIRANVKFLRDVNERVPVKAYASPREFFAELDAALASASTPPI